MNKTFLTPRVLTVTILILAAALTRLLPHYPNFTAVGAIALFGGAYFTDKRIAFLVPLAAMLITDLVIGFHSAMPAVYFSFILIVMIGLSINKHRKIQNIFLASVGASVTFFIITNFAEWAFGIMYPKTAAGLIACYTAAIPFFHYNLLGDLFYVGLLFGAFELAKYRFPVLARIN